MTTHSQLKKTARLTGIWYLLMAISGLLGFMVFHPQLFVDDPQQTLTNLQEQESLARVRLVLEFIIIISQALTAVWFYRLFKGINEWGAWTLGIWGMVNSVAIMISAIAMGTALEVAWRTTDATDGVLASITTLSSLVTNAWGIGSLFFGLWLIPMGYIVTSSTCMLLWLGRTLIIGGAGYLLSTFLQYLGMDGTATELLVIPATIGEFWMIGYLLIFGIRPAGNESGS